MMTCFLLRAHLQMLISNVARLSGHAAACLSRDVSRLLSRHVQGQRAVQNVLLSFFAGHSPGCCLPQECCCWRPLHIAGMKRLSAAYNIAAQPVCTSFCLYPTFLPEAQSPARMKSAAACKQQCFGYTHIGQNLGLSLICCGRPEALQLAHLASRPPQSPLPLSAATWQLRTGHLRPRRLSQRLQRSMMRSLRR